MGGSQRVLHTLAQGFAERGHRVELIGVRPSTEPYAFHARPAYTRATLHRSPAAPGELPGFARLRAAHAARRDGRRARARLARRFAAVRDGYVVAGSPWAVDWLAGVERAHLKCLGQYHESFAQAAATANLRLIQRHYPALEKSVFLSEADAAEFRRLRLPNVAVVPNPLPFDPGPPAPLDTRRVGAVGRLDPVKRLDRLIDAFAAAGRPFPDWELHLFGDGPEEAALRSRAARLGVADRVRFRGTVRDVAAAYRELSVLALTSEYEGRPMALAEASACGVPCVSFDLSGGVRELVADGVTGVLVPPGDVEAFGRALGGVMGDAGVRERYGRAARERVSAFALPVVLDRWEELFEEVDR
ncbi:hypothetical protein AC230_28960 [Streptomyces caatingaensis]|uniref:D-inositol 3-phosphate glycosyltransferase n=2 Tax=Streptomyces caatingaensis TaxID=1678637 RepID=A0A0K9X8Q4_9ACTN|nr:hypothetical protein AC230_28960 [Streptomyces caatingaensis]